VTRYRCRAVNSDAGGVWSEPRRRRKASIKARSEAADVFAANVRPISGVSSLRGVARALTARGVPTARGGSWSDVMVAAVLRR
jgi:hypothetical protein